MARNWPERMAYASLSIPCLRVQHPENNSEIIAASGNLVYMWLWKLGVSMVRARTVGHNFVSCNTWNKM